MTCMQIADRPLGRLARVRERVAAGLRRAASSVEPVDERGGVGEHLLHRLERA